MEMVLVVQMKGEGFPVKLQEPVVDLSNNQQMIFCLVEGGMASGEPAVVIASNNPNGSVVMATSLDKFLAAASSLIGAAEVRFAWTPKAGTATIMPPDRQTRKALLEAMTKELKEWDDADLQT